MENDAISDTGPILHLTEINSIQTINIFSSVSVPEKVDNELKKLTIILPNKIKVINLRSEWKNSVKILTNQYNLDLGEAEAISLALQEKSDYFLTDDLDARNIAKFYNLKVHGTIGILLRAFREKIIDKKTAKERIFELQTRSTLFITHDLIKKAILQIEEFSLK